MPDAEPARLVRNAVRNGSLSEDEAAKLLEIQVSDLPDLLRGCSVPSSCAKRL